VMAASLPSIFALTRASKRDTYIGKLSYPIYVSHLMLLGVARHLGRWRGPVIILLSLLVAALLVHFVEDRVDRWRSRLRGPRAQPSAPSPPEGEALSGRPFP
jgi:peptidoglycan/LPS O-acetylase OafA/YrhL